MVRGGAADLAGQAQEAAGVDGLAGVLGGVVDDRGQAHGPGDGRVPGVVDDVVERLRGEGAQVGGGQGVGVVKVGEEEAEVADDDLGCLFGCVVPVLGVVGQGQGETLAVAAGDPDGLDARKRRDLNVELAGRVPGQPSQGVDAGRQVRGRPGVGLLTRDTVEGAVEALAGPGQDVNEHLKSRHDVRLRGGPGTHRENRAPGTVSPVSVSVGCPSPSEPQRHRAGALATSDSVHGPPVQNRCFASVLSIASLHEI